MDEKEPLEIIRSIQTVEDFKEKKDALFGSLEKMVKTNLEKLRELQGSSLPEEEIKTEFAKFQQSFETMATEMEPEFNRLDAIPEFSQYGDSIRDDFIKRIEPMAKEGEEIMNKLRGEETAGYPRPPPSPSGYSELPPSIQPPPPTPSTKIERQKLDEFETLYGIKSIEELKNSKDLIFDSLRDSLKDTLQKLQSFKNKPREEYWTEYEQFKAYLEVFDNEGKREIGRLQALPGGAEYIETFYKEMESRLGLILEEIDQLRKELR